MGFKQFADRCKELDAKPTKAPVEVVHVDKKPVPVTGETHGDVLNGLDVLRDPRIKG